MPGGAERFVLQGLSCKSPSVFISESLGLGVESSRDCGCFHLWISKMPPFPPLGACSLIK
ncbi:unnamed protein product [Bubo scandiacus]